MASRAKLPPGWETYEFTDEDGCSHESRMLRRRQGVTTWRNAWLGNMSSQRAVMRRLELRVSPEALEEIASAMVEINKEDVEWIYGHDEDGFPLEDA